MADLLLVTVVVMATFGACQAQLCFPGWTLFEQSCYRWYNGPERLDWYNAEEFCRTEAASDCYGYCQPTLVVINSLPENEFLLNYWKTSREPVEPPLGQHYWIGYEQISSSSFTWADGSSRNYENWDNGEPNGGSEPPYCAVMWKGVHNEDVGTWDDQPCRLKKAFICEHKAW